MRVILFTGKGGVGKTTVAAATALRSAQLGHKTIAISTDPAHSLGDSFDMRLGAEPVQIAPNLWGQETDVYFNLERWWGTVQEWIKMLMAWNGIDELTADEMAVLPGMEELSNLMWVNQHAESGQYDVVIVDCAPTAETLRLLSFPDTAGWWVQKLLPIHRRAVRVLRPGVRMFSDIPLPTEEVYEAGEGLIRQLARLHDLLADPEISSMRLVVNAEKMVIKEAQRTFTHLNLYGYVTDAVVCNRLIPADVEDEFFREWKEMQAEHLRFIEECFLPLPILRAPFMSQEVVGVESLERMAEVIYGDMDPTAILYRGRAHELERKDGGYVMTISLPLVRKDEIALVRHGDELIVRAGTHKRNILLPRLLRHMNTTGARFENNALSITFQETGK